jgi:hypothetical protein
MPNPVAIGLALVLALGAYGLLLWLAHPGTRDNLRYARDLVDPRRLVAALRP